MSDLSTVASEAKSDPSPSRSEFDAALVEHFASRQHIGAIAAIVAAFAVTVVIWNHVPNGILIAWLAAQTVVALYSLAQRKRLKRIIEPAMNARTLRAEAIACKSVSGALWGTLAVFSFVYLPESLDFFAAIAVAAVAVGGVSTLAAIPAALYAFILLSFGPFILFWLSGGHPASVTLGLLAILLLAVIMNSARTAHGQIVSVLKAEFDLLQLSDELNTARDTWSELTDSTEAYAVFDQQERLLSWNERYAELMKIPQDLLRRGTPREELIKRALQAVDVASGKLSIEQWLQHRTNSKRTEQVETQLSEFEGGVWIQRRQRYSKNGNLVVSHVDLTELVTMERALGESENRYRLITENSPDPIFVRVEDEIVFVNPAAVKMLRAESETDLLGLSLLSLFHPGDHNVIHKNKTTMAQRPGESLPLTRVRMRRLDGTYVMTEGSAANHSWRDQPAVLITRRDITTQIEAEERLRESESRYRRITELSPNAILIRVEDQIVYANPAAVKMFGADSEADLLYESMMSFVHPDDVHLVLNNRAQMSEDMQSATPVIEVRRRRLDGSYFRCEGSGAPFVWQGQPAVMVMWRDITAEKEADRRLRENEEQLRAIVENMPGSLILKDMDLRIRLASGQNYGEWAGMGSTDVLGKKASDVVSKELAADLERHDREVLESGKVVDVEINTITADGQNRTFMSTRFPVRDDSGAPIGVGIINQDVTRQRKTEAQLQQAQKMEVVGQLTGGIAHDFNNLLTVILGNAELLSEYVQGEPDAERLLQTALKSAQRGADLTQRLLAFSRQQDLNPEPVDINIRIVDMVPLLQRTMPATISLQTEIADNLPFVHIDPTHLESAIMNLVVNARDAVSNEGKIVLATSVVQAHEVPDFQHSDHNAEKYVLVTVTDTGAGMAEDVRDHAFEPFFTTKPVGTGSGLGLSMVYGFVSQSGGHVAIDSVQGRGTSVKLYLPITERAAIVKPAPQPEKAPIDGGNETILVVEDDEDVRALVVGSLTKLGYQVVSAGNGPEAVAAVAELDTVDMLLTDVVLPGGMQGPEIAREVSKQHRDVRVLLMSGYTRGIDTAAGELDETYDLIQKPFTRAELGARVRQVIDIADQTPTTVAQA